MKIKQHDLDQISFQSDRTISIRRGWTCAGCTLDEVKNWAGNVGDIAKITTPNCTIGEDAGMRVAALDIKATAPGIFTVDFQLKSVDDTPLQIGGVTYNIDRDGAETKSASFILHQSQAATYTPAIGSIVDWAEQAFVCESVQLTPGEADSVKIAVTLKKVTTLSLGNPSFSTSIDEVTSARQLFFVGSANLTAFLAGQTVGQVADWAGENFYLQSVEVAPYGKIGYKVTLTARDLATRMLRLTRDEALEGFAGGDTAHAVKSINYTAIFQVRTEDLADFADLTGTTPEWAPENTVVTKVTPKKLSPAEYEVTLLLEHRSNPGMFLRYQLPDYENLSTVVYVTITLRNFRMTLAQCGLIRNRQGELEQVEGFSPDVDSPLSDPDGAGVVYPDTPLKIMYFKVISFLAGKVTSNINTIVDFGLNRIFIGRISGYYGYYLKENIIAEDFTDRTGHQWSKLTCEYSLAPYGLNWNVFYWDGDHHYKFSNL